MSSTPVTVPSELDEAMRGFVDEYRSRCLWFMRPDYYPETMDQREEVLRLIAQHGDVAALNRVADFRRWLSLPTNATSATC